jgi:hypothetical protein
MKSRISILVLRNTAGAITPVADWLVENGHQAVIVEPAKIDIFALTSYSKNAIMTHGRNFYMKALDCLLDRRPDVIHVNTSHLIVSFVRFFAPRTPLVLMYHGSEIRERMKVGLGHRQEVCLVDKTIVSTRDLRAFGEWFDRPIPRYFKYQGGRKKRTALMVYADFFADAGKDQRKMARRVCEELGLELTIREKRNIHPLPNSEMPALYSKYEYFLDFKGFDTPKTFALSKSALEAMRCGCKVLHDSNPYTPINPDECLAGEELYQKYLKMYQSLKPVPYRQVVPRLIRNIGIILMTPNIAGYNGQSTRPTPNGMKRVLFYLLIMATFILRRFGRKTKSVLRGR